MVGLKILKHCILSQWILTILVEGWKYSTPPTVANMFTSKDIIHGSLQYFTYRIVSDLYEILNEGKTCLQACLGICCREVEIYRFYSLYWPLNPFPPVLPAGKECLTKMMHKPQDNFQLLNESSWCTLKIDCHYRDTELTFLGAIDQCVSHFLMNLLHHMFWGTLLW